MLFASGLFTFAPEVISLLYSDKYLPGVPVFRIYSIVLLFRCTYFGIILNSIGKTKFIFYSSIVALGLNIVLNYILYRIFGFLGPALATIVSVAAVQVFQLKATSQSISVPLRKVFPWKALGVITIINVFIGIIFAFIKEAVSLDIYTGDILESMILGVAWSVLYGLLMQSFIKHKWVVLNEKGYYSKEDYSASN